jgi:hypothetical protein
LILTGGCSATGSPPSSLEPVGSATIAIANAPSNAACIEITAAGTRTVTSSFNLVAGESTLFTVGGLPLGQVTFSAQAFAVACMGVTATSVPTWVDNAPLSAKISVSPAVAITLNLVPTGNASITVNFEDASTGNVACSGSSCCEPSAGPVANGNGEFTCYTFAQGTVNDKTFCGYQGTETAFTGGGSGTCQTGGLAFSDTVPNVGTNSGFFVAFPTSNPAWGQGALCGMCVNVTFGGTTLMATVVDACPTCSDSPEHLNLSANLARALSVGVGTTTGEPTGVSWAAVACPITSNGGDIVVVWSGGSSASGKAYFQNVVFPIASVAVGGSIAVQDDGFWPVSAGTTVTLTDLLGHKITAVMPTGTNATLGVQFPATCP